MREIISINKGIIIKKGIWRYFNVIVNFFFKCFEKLEVIVMERKIKIKFMGRMICWWFFILNKLVILRIVLYIKIDVLKKMVINRVKIIIVFSFLIKLNRLIFLIVVKVGNVDFCIIFKFSIDIFKVVV